MLVLYYVDSQFLVQTFADSDRTPLRFTLVRSNNWHWLRSCWGILQNDKTPDPFVFASYPAKVEIRPIKYLQNNCDMPFSAMMIPSSVLFPATEALERYQRSHGDSRAKRSVQINFDSTSLYLELMAVEVPGGDNFPCISWSDSSDNESETSHALPKKISLKKLKRRSKHRMVRSKSQYKLSCLCESPSSNWETHEEK